MVSEELAISAQSVDQSVQVEADTLTILQDVSLQIKAGSTAAIVGRSGAGKSTLLSLLAGLDVPSNGSIEVFGQSLSASNEEKRAALRAQYIGFVFQSFQLLPQLTCWENITLPLTLLDKPVDKENIEHHLHQVGLLERKKAYPPQLSGGEQQRIALARAFSLQPKILFADEPTGNLDNVTGDHVADLMMSMNEEAGTTLLVVTHDMTLAERCGTVYRLDQGRLQQQ